MDKQYAERLMRFIDKSPSVYHTIRNLGDFLNSHGFIELKRKDIFDLEQEGKYFIKNNILPRQV